MNWILLGLIILVAQKHQNYNAALYGLMANPLPIATTGSPQIINPYIKHWEPANFDQNTLFDANEQHLRQKIRRKKRELNGQEYGPVNTIKLKFYAHDREFRLVLRQNPSSVFSPDVEIENTLGPVDYDISRIYTGSLEDDESAYVQAILTRENLLDGTISTRAEQYYVEPSHRYSKDLPEAGIHTIVYKLSDVNMAKSMFSSRNVLIPSLFSETSESQSSSLETETVAPRTEHYCASERLRQKLLKTDFWNLSKTRRKRTTTRKNIQSTSYKDITSSNSSVSEVKEEKHTGQQQPEDISLTHKRRTKRWLPDEIPDVRRGDPPLPLDLDVAYNTDFISLSNPGEDSDSIRAGLESTDSASSNNHSQTNQNLSDFYRNRDLDSRSGFIITPNGGVISSNPPSGGFFTKSNRNRNILVNNYNPNSDFNLRNHFTNRNILVNSFNNTTNNNFNKFNNFYNNNYDSIGANSDTNSGSGGSSDNNNNSTSRPSHKTHVEIITKNGATKRPNIIVNNYNPDVILTSQSYNSHLNLVHNDIADGSGSKSAYDKKSTCMLYLQADHTFFQKMGSDEASIEAITRHVQRANTIYKNTDFNGDGRPDNITFMIKRIKVHNMNALKDPAYRFPGNYGVEKFLELFSEEDYDAFCLAYMFTYRDFEMGTLGLAWTGDLKNAGGVCEKNGHYRGSLKSLNTGIVTLLNYGKHVPPAVSHVTLAHEIGHNFGSPHDPEQCTPGGEDGNYIMFARATSGDKRNNNKFSPCSLKSIEPVLNAKARSAKGCFTEPQRSICGNGVVEPDEQCDCGWEEDCKDSCCFPMSRHPRSDEKPCTLTPRAMCSPSQGPCCTTDCALKFGDKCRDDNGCRDPSFCDGRLPYCPPSVNKPNKTICNKEFVCFMGECTGSICLAYGLESCQCLPGPNDPKTKSCELCCKQPGENNPCKSSFEWNEAPFDVPDMYAKPGTPCNDYNGYCDVFQKCREVDPSGPLATLRKLLLSEESIASFKKWIQTNWYTVVLAFVGVVILLVGSTKFLGKRSNLKLKSVTIIHSATTETVRLPEDNNGVIVHTAIRTKVPFKKKVRGERAKKVTLTSKVANNSSAAATHQKTLNPKNTVVLANAKGGGFVTKATKRSLSSSDVPKKITRKKNRVSAPVAEEQQTNAKQSAESDGKKSKKGKTHKEVIDYSKSTASSPPNTNTFGKVQKWLLESPIVAQPLSQVEHNSKVRKIMCKSQSTPEKLTQKSPTKTKSAGNLNNDKVKLQVVYKPPFKISLKLSKNSAVKTHVIGGAIGKGNRKVRPGDKKRISSTAIAAGGGLATSNPPNKIANRRAALLARTAGDEIEQEQPSSSKTEQDEPNYETLNPKKMDNPFYENLVHNSKPTSAAACFPTDQTNLFSSLENQTHHGINSSSHVDIFRVKKSASNSSLARKSSQANNTSLPVNYNRSNSLTVSNSNALKNQMSVSNSRKSSHDNSINRHFGSTQNLIHGSSHGSLAKSKNRNSLNLKSSASSSATNDYYRLGLVIVPTKRSSSNANLRRENSSSNLKINDKLNCSRTNLSRNSSNSNLKLSGSLNHGSMSNIPRATLVSSSALAGAAASASASAFSRQKSLQPKETNLNSNNNISVSNNIKNINIGSTANKGSISVTSNNHSRGLSATRPYTATCDNVRHFEWPKLSPSNSHSQYENEHIRTGKPKDDPMSSNLEVMVSDVENLVS